MKPNSIADFEKLLLLSSSVTVFNILVHYAALRSAALANGASPAGPILGVLIAVGFYLLFRVAIGKLVSNVAKWCFVAWTGLSLLAVPVTLPKTMSIGLSYALLDCLSLLAQITALAMLFHKDTKAWLLGRRRAAPQD